MAASYSEVTELGLINVVVPPRTGSVHLNVRQAFNEEMVRLARRMARVNIKGKARNRPLLSALLDAFKDVSYELLFTRDQIHRRRRPDCTYIFVLQDQGSDGTYGEIEKPHVGHVVLMRDTNGTLVIPHPDGLIPFKLDAMSIGSIRGPAGKKIRRAFHEGQAGLKHGVPAVHRYSRSVDRNRADLQEAADYLSGATISAQPERRVKAGGPRLHATSPRRGRPSKRRSSTLATKHS